MRDLFSPPHEPFGYRCGACDHAWDAPPGPPCSSAAEVMMFLHDKVKAEEVHCPECGVIGPAVLSPLRYAERKAEREMQAMGASAA